MEIERRNAGDATILAFAGEFDWFSMPEISKQVDALVRERRTHLVFNLRSLEFIDSSALGYLIKTHKRLKRGEGALVLSEPSKFFRTTIGTLGLDRFFKIYPDDDEAVRHFDAARPNG